MKHILYLPSWFPSRRDPYPGDFIKRHAEAASLYNRITVFYTAIDETIKEPELMEEKINENLDDLYLLLSIVKRNSFTGNKWSKKIFSVAKNV